MWREGAEPDAVVVVVSSLGTGTRFLGNGGREGRTSTDERVLKTHVKCGVR